MADSFIIEQDDVIDVQVAQSPPVLDTILIEGPCGATTWAGITGKPAVIASGATQEQARTAIGAGTSSLVIGTTSTTAKRGDYTPTTADVTGLDTALAGKAAASHTHSQSDVTGLADALAGKEPTIAAGTTAQYYRGDKTWQTLNAAAVGLGNTLTVLNTSATLMAVSGNHHVYLLQASAVPTMPTAVGNSSWYTIKNASTTPITLNTSSSQTIDNSTLALTPMSSVDLVSDGANWLIVGASPSPDIYSSVSFNGSSMLGVPYYAGFDLSSGDWSLECWFKASSFASSASLLSKDTWGANFDWSVELINATTIRMMTNGAQSILTATVPTMSTGSWYHVAVSRSSGTNRVFLNGVQAGSNTMAISNAANSSGVRVTIGAASWNNPNAFFTGSISNVRIVKGTGYSANFTPSSVPLTAVSGTSLLTCQSSTLRDNSSAASSILVLAGAPTILAANPF